MFKEIKNLWYGVGCSPGIRAMIYIAYMEFVIFYKIEKTKPIVERLLYAYEELLCNFWVYNKPNKLRSKIFFKLRDLAFKINYKWVDEELYNCSDWDKLLKNNPDLVHYFQTRKQIQEKITDIVCDDLRWDYKTYEKFWDWVDRAYRNYK